MIALSPGCSELTLSALCEWYRRPALSVRNLSVDYVESQLVYLNRLFEFLGSPGTASELFAVLDQGTLIDVPIIVSQYLKDGFRGTTNPGSVSVDHDRVLN